MGGVQNPTLPPLSKFSKIICNVCITQSDRIKEEDELDSNVSVTRPNAIYIVVIPVSGDSAFWFPAESNDLSKNHDSCVGP